MLLVRAALSLYQAAVASGGLRPVPLLDPISTDGTSILWPALWGLLSLGAAWALALRLQLGWVVGLAVAVAYLVTGISDVSVIQVGMTTPPDVGAALVIELGIPLFALAVLFALRPAYGRRVAAPLPVSPLDRLRRGR